MYVPPRHKNNKLSARIRAKNNANINLDADQREKVWIFSQTMTGSHNLVSVQQKRATTAGIRYRIDCGRVADGFS